EKGAIMIGAITIAATMATAIITIGIGGKLVSVKNGGTSHQGRHGQANVPPDAVSAARRRFPRHAVRMQHRCGAGPGPAGPWPMDPGRIKPAQGLGARAGPYLA